MGELADLIRSDTLLPDGIRPNPGPVGHSGNAVLVTGATGFVGSYLTLDLIRRGDCEIFCLVRDRQGKSGRLRLIDSLNRAGANLIDLPDCVHVLTGELGSNRLGLTAEDYDRLGRAMRTIFHCGAEVNWTRSYRQLRATNVLGTLELLKLASIAPLHRFIFVSTIAVCFAHRGPDRVDEFTDMAAYVEDMPLGYAQTKAISEHLLRIASGRGFSVSILRPGLISGHSLSGHANDSGDLISALLEGCVAAGAAIDADWLVDCTPVDTVVQVISRLQLAERPNHEVLHLTHESARHWRELVLWLNLYGYRVALEETERWLVRLFNDPMVKATSLFGYRRFFSGLGLKQQHRRPFEAYLAHAQKSVDSSYTRKVLGELGIALPPLDSTLLKRYFRHYARVGLLPATRYSYDATLTQPLDARRMGEMLSRYLHFTDADLIATEAVPMIAVNGIFNEISAIRSGPGVGISRYRLTIKRRSSGELNTMSVVVKAKAEDAVMQALLAEVASLCDPTLGYWFGRFKDRLGLTRSHVRELAIYRLPEPQLRHHMPDCLATFEHPGQKAWSVVMEYIDGVESFGDDGRSTCWQSDDIKAGIDALSEIHAPWFCREEELLGQPWLAPAIDTHQMAEMAPLWRALAAYSDRFFRDWTSVPLLPIQNAIISAVPHWWAKLISLPRSLIHQDFNPRNLAIMKSVKPTKLIVYDWELAGLGVPQHDLAELLCFVCDEGITATELYLHIEQHRIGLQRESGIDIDPANWLWGFASSLDYLIINRLPMYSLMHRFKPQVFLPQVIRNWVDLRRACTELLTDRGFVEPQAQ